MNERTQDRWTEIDIAYFDIQDPEGSAKQLMERLKPLYANVGGDIGIFINCGWVLSLITEWTGNLEQQLPMPGERFLPWGNENYGRLKKQIAEIKEQAAKVGLPHFQVGFLTTGFGEMCSHRRIGIYGFEGQFYRRHPEVYIEGGWFPCFDPRASLKPDQYPYATAPGGLTEETPVVSLLAQQWKALSDAVGFDALMLRDQFTGPMLYRRVGPWGIDPGEDPVAIKEWEDSFCRMYRELKQAAPDRLLFGYSSAVGAVAEHRIGAFDLEAIVAEGYIDGWIDQTWGGAWQDFAALGTIAWTFQLAFLLFHRNMIANGNKRRKGRPCRHFHLVETLDSWEAWDVIHQDPGKLRWGIWAFAHAAARDGDSIIPSNGACVSWMNSRFHGLLSEADVSFLSQHLDAADASARKMNEVAGPVALYNRTFQRELVRKDPACPASDAIDDQLGLLIKWGVPCLSVGNLEDIEELRAVEGCVVQTPAGADDATVNKLIDLAEQQLPVALHGRADLFSTGLTKALGLQTSQELRNRGYLCGQIMTDKTGFAGVNNVFVPDTTFVQCDDSVSTSLFETKETVLVCRNQSRPLIYMQPLDWQEPENPDFRKAQIGSIAPYVLEAQVMNDALASSDQLAAAQRLIAHLPFTLHAWRSDGKIYILAGNLETGWVGDSRFERKVFIRIPSRWLNGMDREYVLEDIDSGARFPVERDGQNAGAHLTIPPDACLILNLNERDQ